MIHCISCGTQLPSEAVHCPKCGAVTPYNVSASGVSPDDLTSAPSSSVSTENKPSHDSDIPPEIVLLQGPYDLINPYASPPPPPSRRRVKPVLLISILVATLILASGGIVTGFILGTKNIPRGSGSTPPLTTASSSGSTVTSTASAQTSGTPSTVATLAASTSNSYSSQYRTLALNDSFAETVATWDASSTCQFTNKAYNVTTVRGFTLCKDNATSDSYNNFVYQAQMQFLTQDTCGGLLFRNQTSSLLADYYEFYICTDGTYHLGVVGGLYNSLADGSSLFNTGLEQANVIAVVAQKSQITIYINGKMVNQASDDHFSGGAIGLFSFNLTNHSSTDEVAFNNVKVWTS